MHFVRVKAVGFPGQEFFVAQFFCYKRADAASAILHFNTLRFDRAKTMHYENWKCSHDSLLQVIT